MIFDKSQGKKVGYTNFARSGRMSFIMKYKKVGLLKIGRLVLHKETDPASVCRVI